MRSVLLLAVGVVVAQEYFLGKEGATCYDTCMAQSLNCDPHIETDNSPNIFKLVGANCTPDARDWWAEDQPSVVVDPSDPNYGKCLGYTNVPGGVLCSSSYPAVQRVCHCVSPAKASPVGALGTGCSQCGMPTTETTFFAHILPVGVTGVLNHFWITGGQSDLADVRYNYYIDGESTPSISFIPGKACGVGFNDAQAPWGTKWFGKGAADGAWFFNFPIPFYKSVRVTAYRPTGAIGFYYIIRGVVQQPGVPVRIGNYELPKGARLRMIETKQQTVPAFAWVPLVDIPTGSGVFFMHTLMVSSADENFLEGCYHAYTPYNQTFPGILLSTGTEDYFDSAWYFNAGEFHFPVSGFTHFARPGGGFEWSGYRFHEMDPLPFENGFKFVWRNGDVSSGNIKCFTETSSGTNVKPVLRTPVKGDPPNYAPSDINAYAWVYTW